MELGPHTAFICSSYAVVTLVLTAVVGWLVLDERWQQQRIDELEARGVRRRSDRGREPR